MVAFGLLLYKAFGTLGIVVRTSEQLAPLVVPTPRVSPQYGDIGTSPLYVLSNVFNGTVPINSDTLRGVISCIFWSQLLLLVRLLHYMHTSNDVCRPGHQVCVHRTAR
jgi:hypothetical protein